MSTSAVLQDTFSVLVEGILVAGLQTWNDEYKTEAFTNIHPVRLNIILFT